MSARGTQQPPAAARRPTNGALLAVAMRELVHVTDTPLLDAQLLLAYATGQPRSTILAYPERAVPLAAAEQFDRLVVRRVRGEPLAYLVRSQEFYSLPLKVSPAVLIPRPETELLVDEALTRCPPEEPKRVLDLGTGSGAIALAIKKERPAAEVTAADVSAAALAVARANAERLGLDVRFVESNWFSAFAGERFDLIVCNAPYVAADDPAFAGLAFEPRLALDGGPDGLDSLRVVISSAAAHLAPGGWVLLEHGHDQREPLIEIATRNGWRVAAARDDLEGRARVLGLARP